MHSSKHPPLEWINSEHFRCLLACPATGWHFMKRVNEAYVTFQVTFGTRKDAGMCRSDPLKNLQELQAVPTPTSDRDEAPHSAVNGSCLVGFQLAMG